ncbi:hypothetical protein [Paenibacillus sp. JJ-100]|uniref:hypothetical protein n=1 Tax=Paenibacillus sp. JJ-100 TaxID=2974896 RepID=UPI00232DEF3C|nr:hypothetical protein [Paenibacillus sp. JJ-100]
MKRFEDEPAFKYSYYAVLKRGERVDVRCPTCGGHAYIEYRNRELRWKCSECYAQAVKEEEYEYKAKGYCSVCERWFNVEVTNEKMKSHSLVHITCPHCGAGNQAKLHKQAVGRGYYLDIRRGRDPIFDLELYFLDYIRGKQIWAVNREHLNYLIAYVSADLRVKYGGSMIKTASHSIPAYIKEAKNREAVTRILSKMQMQSNAR